MNWILFYQTINDNVKYITSDQENPSFMSYKRFSGFLRDFPILKEKEMIDALDSFKTIIFYTNECRWEIVEIEKRLDVTYEELLELNKKDVEEEDVTLYDVVVKARDKMIGAFAKIKDKLF